MGNVPEWLIIALVVLVLVLGSGVSSWFEVKMLLERLKDVFRKERKGG